MRPEKVAFLPLPCLHGRLMHGRIVISVLVVCGAFAAGSPSAALAADLPLPAATGAVREQVAAVQRSVPPVAVAPVAGQVAREALPSAVAAPAERVTKQVHDIASPAQGSAEHVSRTSRQAPPHAESGSAAQPARHAKRVTRARPAAARHRSVHSPPSERRSEVPSPARRSHSASRHQEPLPHGPPAPQLPAISSATMAGFVLGGSLLAVLLGALGTWMVRRPLNRFSFLPPSAALCSAIERPG